MRASTIFHAPRIALTPIWRAAVKRFMSHFVEHIPDGKCRHCGCYVEPDETQCDICYEMRA